MNGVRLLVPVVLLVGLCVVMSVPMVARADPSATDRARNFVTAHEAKVRPLEVAANLAWWNANTTGKDEDFKKKEESQNRLDAVLADPAHFREVKDIKDKGGIE